MSGYVVGLTLRRLPVDDHGLLLVALALADQADGAGNGVYPSVDLVAVETRLSRRAVQYKTSELEQLGFIVLVERGGGRKRPNRWRIDIDWLATQPDRVVAMRREKASRIQSSINGAHHAQFIPGDKWAVDKLRVSAVTAQKQCRNDAQVGAPNPTTLSPASNKPPPIEELVEAALWQASSSNTPPLRRAAYAAAVRRRLSVKVTLEDIAVWRSWLAQLEIRHELRKLQGNVDDAAA